MGWFKAGRRNINLQYSLAPLYYVTTLFGLSSYTSSGSNEKTKLKQSRLCVIYNVLFCCILAGLYLHLFRESIKYNYNDNNNHSTDIIDLFNLYKEPAIMVLNILLNIGKQGKIIKAQKCLMKLDGHLRYLGADLNYSKPRFLIAGYISSTSALFVILEYLRCSTFYKTLPESELICFIMCLVPTLVKSLAQSQFVSYVYLLHQRFALLNGVLRKSHQKKIHVLSATRKLHARLCEVGRCINDAFSFQMLVMIASDFVNIAVLMYYCYVRFSKLLLRESTDSLESIVSLALSTAYKLFQMFALSLVCCWATNEANDSQRVIYKGHIFDASVSSQVNFFGEQIAHWRFKFTAFDFFDIDMTLIYSVVCAATTYLLIFIQLNLGN